VACGCPRPCSGSSCERIRRSVAALQLTSMARVGKASQLPNNLNDPPCGADGYAAGAPISAAEITRKWAAQTIQRQVPEQWCSNAVGTGLTVVMRSLLGKGVFSWSMLQRTAGRWHRFRGPRLNKLECIQQETAAVERQNFGVDLPHRHSLHVPNNGDLRVRIGHSA
jgi:hypothetical protein